MLDYDYLLKGNFFFFWVESVDFFIIFFNFRSILGFGLMILCGVNRNFFDYNGYGCYCGFGGEGILVDDVDR